MVNKDNSKVKVLRQKSTRNTLLAYNLLHSEAWEELLLPVLMSTILGASNISENLTNDHIIRNSIRADYARNLINLINESATIEASSRQETIIDKVVNIGNRLKGLLLNN